jgi:hypothetical protein
MARDKVKKVGTHRTRIPLGIQDGTDLVTEILGDVEVTLIEPIEVRIEIIEGLIERILAALAAAGLGSMKTADVELGPYLAGHVDVEGSFTDAQIGAPVLVGQGDPIDDMETIPLFAGQVIDARTLRLVWQANSPPPRKVRINYIIGTTLIGATP